MNQTGRSPCLRTPIRQRKLGNELDWRHIGGCMHEPDSRYQERKKNEELVMLHR